MISTPERPPLRYHGGKWRLALRIISQFPIHRCYVEPFGGAAGVLLQKRPSEVEVYNDLSRAVVNFFKMLREREAELIRAIELTPFARAEFELAHEQTDDEFEAARRFYILSWQARGGPSLAWRTGWRHVRRVEGGASSVRQWNAVGHLWAVAARLKLVQIECQPAGQVIGRFDAAETLFYCDPPYVTETRSKWRGSAYEFEMSDEQHRELAASLHAIKGMAIISGYPSALYEELYGDWLRVCCETTTDTASVATECLWLSPAAAKRGRQMAMFAERGGR